MRWVCTRWAASASERSSVEEEEKGVWFGGGEGRIEWPDDVRSIGWEVVVGSGEERWEGGW